jgi:hypothetical protein
MTASLSNREKLLYDAIRDVGGGIIPEDVLRQKTGLGHATLWAARHGLIEKGLLEIGKKSGKTTFRLLKSAASPSTCSSSMTSNSTPRTKTRKTATAASTSTPTTSTSQTSAASADARKSGKKKKSTYEKVQPFAEVEADLPHVVGDFLDIDDWTEALLAELGDVDVSPSLTSDTEYTVYAHDFHREDRYEVIETADGISVS